MIQLNGLMHLKLRSSCLDVIFVSEFKLQFYKMPGQADFNISLCYKTVK